MSNEMKDWFWDKVTEVILDANVFDRIDKVLITSAYHWRAEVYGIKDNFYEKYKVWFDDDDGWHYERSEE